MQKETDFTDERFETDNKKWRTEKIDVDEIDAAEMNNLKYATMKPGQKQKKLSVLK